MTENLLPNFRRAERAVPCACGGFVTADPTSSVLIERAVQAHQRTLRHLDWRARFEEGGDFIVGRVVVTADGTFLEPLERYNEAAARVAANGGAAVGVPPHPGPPAESLGGGSHAHSTDTP